MASPCKSFTLCSMDSLRKTPLSKASSKQRSHVVDEKSNHHEECDERGDQPGDEKKARALRPVRPVEPGVEQAHISQIGFPRRVENVAGEGNDADHPLDRDIE